VIATCEGSMNGLWRGVRRATILRIHFLRNLAYYRAGWTVHVEQSGAQFPGSRKTVMVVLPPPISGANRLYAPTMPETTATFCTPRAR
jgi:hypothetical protein